jgi:glycosyltransferase involved in cell wall biosynthesis
MGQSVTFATPTFPSFRGNGLAMRAAATLRLLRAWGADVHLLVIPIYDAGVTEPEPEIAGMCRSWQMVCNPDPFARAALPSEWRQAISQQVALPPEWQRHNGAWQRLVSDVVERQRPDLIVVFRFYLAPFIIAGGWPSIPVWLDLDEAESTCRARLAHLKVAAGKQQEAFDLRMEALAYEQLELRYLRLFERIFAASEIECKGILARGSEADIRVLPNVYPSVRPQQPRKADGKACFLYVGTFGHYPNVDALLFFCKEVLPRVRAGSPIPVELYVIGSGLPALGEQPSMPGVYFNGPVPETTPYYAGCDVAVVPLRAGGGTRIKILEAFSHKRAVVSTSVGAEGLAVTAGVHLRIADSAEDFASHCLQLIHEARKREILAERGHAFFREHHTLEHLEGRLPEFFGCGSLAT